MMIVPFAIFAVDSTQKITENRTGHYVVKSFNGLYRDRLSTLPSWTEWVKQVESIGEKCRGAFEGTVNLHNHRDEIARLAAVFANLRKEFESASKQ